MPRINLLPWREELRKQRQKEFGIAAAGAVAGAVAIVLGSIALYNGRIAHQNERNRYLDKEIAEMDKQIEEIQELETVKEQTLARMDVIEKLQSSRPEVVHLFDELPRLTPDGVHLTRVRQSGSRITITGQAQSSTRVSALMRNLDSSDWFTNPGLEKVETVEGPSDGSRASEFTVFVQQTRPGGTEEDEG